MFSDLPIRPSPPLSLSFYLWHLIILASFLPGFFIPFSSPLIFLAHPFATISFCVSPQISLNFPSRKLKPPILLAEVQIPSLSNRRQIRRRIILSAQLSSPSIEIGKVPLILGKSGKEGKKGGRAAQERGQTKAGQTTDECRRMRRVMALVAVVSIANWASRKAQCLECIQCDRQTLWYSPEENERHIARCQRGLIPPSQCANSSHTHCIFNYFKQGGVITVTERRCGTTDEISGCTLYKSMMRAKRHLIAGSAIDVEPTKLWRVAGNAGQSPPSHRRRETNPLVVEVCTGGCKEDGCVNGGAGRGGGVGLVGWMAVLIGWTGWWTSRGTIRVISGSGRHTR